MSADTMPGYAGKLLRVNLTTGEISTESLDESICKRYLGGTILGVKILYEEVSPEIDWSDPENRVIMASGPLGGTRFCGTGTYSLVTKGAMTNGATSTQANGFFGPYLKFSGFDGIIIQGAAKEWVYIYIHDGIAELRDAGHLLGKNTWETEDAIKQELGVNERGMSVFGIGPAGENLVSFAGVVGDKGHIAAHNGPGAVFGSKKLKAVAVARGRGRVEVTDPQTLSALSAQAVETGKTNAGGQVYNYGTTGIVLWANGQSWLPVKNYTTNIYDIDKEKLQKYSAEYIRSHFEPKPTPCWACQFHHVHRLTLTEGPYKGEEIEEPEYEGYASMGALIGVTDIDLTMKLANDADRLGIDTNESGWIIAFAMECYEKGILSKEQLDGLDLRWGNAEAVRTLLQKIAKREGCGELFAGGVKRAAERLGGEALNMAIHSKKGNTPRSHDHRAMWFEMFDTSVSDTGTLESRGSMTMESLGLSRTEPFSWEEVATLVAKTRGSMQFEDSLGVCGLVTNINVDLLTKALNAVTGWGFTIEDSMRAGRMAVNMMRVFNLRAGISPELDAPSLRYGSTPIDGLAEGVAIAPNWGKMLNIYYDLMGWDRETGKPLPQTLREFGLEGAVSQIWE